MLDKQHIGYLFIAAYRLFYSLFIMKETHFLVNYGAVLPYQIHLSANSYSIGPISFIQISPS